MVVAALRCVGVVLRLAGDGESACAPAVVGDRSLSSTSPMQRRGSRFMLHHLPPAPSASPPPEEDADVYALLIPRPPSPPPSPLPSSSPHSHHPHHPHHPLLHLPLRLLSLLPLLPLHLRLLLPLTLLLLLDHLIHPPHGLLPLTLFLSLPRHSPPTPCGWDYEASWKVGVARGTSPLTLSFTHTNSHLNPLLTCASIPHPPTSFLADPFLVHPPPPLNSSTTPTPPASPSHIFVEIKNLLTNRGEIGVFSLPPSSPSPSSSSSSPPPSSPPQWLGVALAEQFHLSYPYVVYLPLHSVYVLIPESSTTRSVRLYTSPPSSYPLSWSYHSSPLTSHPYVDTSPILYHGLWYIFTTHSDSLHLYTSPDLLTHPWTPHPLSPLLSHDRRLSRSAGPPFLFDGRMHRLAQDDRAFYGAGVTVMEVEEVGVEGGRGVYREREVGLVEPGWREGQGQDWVTERLHHIDVHRGGRGEGGEGEGEWWALVDGDERMDDYQFWQREGWFRRAKSVLLLLALLATATSALHLYMQHHRRHPPHLAPPSPLPFLHSRFFPHALFHKLLDSLRHHPPPSVASSCPSCVCWL